MTASSVELVDSVHMLVPFQPLIVLLALPASTQKTVVLTTRTTALSARQVIRIKLRDSRLACLAQREKHKMIQDSLSARTVMKENIDQAIWRTKKSVSIVQRVICSLTRGEALVLFAVVDSINTKRDRKSVTSVQRDNFCLELTYSTLLFPLLRVKCVPMDMSMMMSGSRPALRAFPVNTNT